MRVSNLKEMEKGWFVGNFIPNILQTNLAEVAIKTYQTGDCECKHYHKIATEITVIVTGKVRMNGIEYGEGDIILMEPGDATDFEALSDVVNAVVKMPSVMNDKYEVI